MACSQLGSDASGIGTISALFWKEDGTYRRKEAQNRCNHFFTGFDLYNWRKSSESDQWIIWRGT